MSIRIHRAMLVLTPTLIAACFAACSSDDTLIVPQPDGGRDAGSDAPSNVDAGRDAAIDTGTDAAVDTGTDAATDASADAQVDADGGTGAHVTSSDPREGASGVYPLEVYDSGAGVAERKRIALSFSAPMDKGSVRAELTKAGGAARAVEGVWDADALRIVFTLVPPDPNDPESHPLDENASYRLDVRALRDASGQPLDAAHPSLGDGVLDFSTGANDALLNHACYHTLFGPFENIAATPTAAGAPTTQKTHRQYTVTLPANDAGASAEGYTRFRFSTGTGKPTDYIFYFASLVPTQVQNETTGAPVAFTSQGETPPACPGITHFVRLTTGSADTHAAKFGPIAEQSFKFMIEAP